MRRLLLPATAALAATTALVATTTTANANVTLTPLGTYASGVFDESAAEIVAFDPGNDVLFVVNADAGAIEVLDVADPTDPTTLGVVTSTLAGGTANSVAAADGLVAVVVAADVRTDRGVLELFDADDLSDGDATPLAVVTLGANPDMVTFTPDGDTLLVANEGEPSDDYTVDPEGSVSVIDLPASPADLDQGDVRTARFTAFDAEGVDGVRVFGPGASFSQDMEPEYITVAGDGATAYVVLQENNALATLDVASATITDVAPLGTKDHYDPANVMDASDDDGEFRLAQWPVRGMFMPDAIASVDVGATTYVLTANEGDAREYIVEDADGEEVEVFVEEARVADLELCLNSPRLAGHGSIVSDDEMGRLAVTTTMGQRDGEDCYEELFSFGARSFSVFLPDGTLVWDSGSDFERITGELLGSDANSNNDENGSGDSRSDAKGPEPEGIVVGTVSGRTYAFIGLERVGGIMIYDVTDPTAPTHVDYVTTRRFDVPAELEDGSPNPAAGDLAPEGLAFISAADSPTGRPLLAVGHEVSGTTTLFEVAPAG